MTQRQLGCGRKFWTLESENPLFKAQTLNSLPICYGLNCDPSLKFMR